MTSRFLLLCERRLTTGGVLLVAGDWRSEAALYRVLSLSLARLRRKGITTAVAGGPFIADEAPERPDSDVAVLLEARSFADLGRWSDVQRSRLSILTALDSDLSMEVDFPINVPDSSTADRRALLRVSEVWNHEPAGRSGLVASALGVDVPTDWSGDLLVPVATVEGLPLPWMSTESPWLTWHVLEDRITAVLVEQASHRLSAYPAMAKRLLHRWKRRSSLS